jgi:hypothetical protein
MSHHCSFFIIYHEMYGFEKIRSTSGKASTNRAENIFPKYFLYHVHEIARKYPREKKRYSSFCDSVEHNKVADSDRYDNKVAEDMPLFGLSVSWTLQENKTGAPPGSFPLFPLP